MLLFAGQMKDRVANFRQILSSPRLLTPEAILRFTAAFAGKKLDFIATSWRTRTCQKIFTTFFLSPVTQAWILEWKMIYFNVNLCTKWPLIWCQFSLRFGGQEDEVTSWFFIRLLVDKFVSKWPFIGCQVNTVAGEMAFDSLPKWPFDSLQRFVLNSTLICCQIFVLKYFVLMLNLNW